MLQCNALHVCASANYQPASKSAGPRYKTHDKTVTPALYQPRNHALTLQTDCWGLGVHYGTTPTCLVNLPLTLSNRTHDACLKRPACASYHRAAPLARVLVSAPSTASVRPQPSGVLNQPTNIRYHRAPHERTAWHMVPVS